MKLEYIRKIKTAHGMELIRKRESKRYREKERERDLSVFSIFPMTMIHYEL